MFTSNKTIYKNKKYTQKVATQQAQWEQEKLKQGPIFTLDSNKTKYRDNDSDSLLPNLPKLPVQKNNTQNMDQFALIYLMLHRKATLTTK